MSQHDTHADTELASSQRVRGFIERSSAEGWYVPYVPKADLLAVLNDLAALQARCDAGDAVLAAVKRCSDGSSVISVQNDEFDADWPEITEYEVYGIDKWEFEQLLFAAHDAAALRASAAAQRATGTTPTTEGE